MTILKNSQIIENSDRSLQSSGESPKAITSSREYLIVCMVGVVKGSYLTLNSIKYFIQQCIHLKGFWMWIISKKQIHKVHYQLQFILLLLFMSFRNITKWGMVFEGTKSLGGILLNSWCAILISPILTHTCKCNR
jgi:hypothetical protein